MQELFPQEEGVLGGVVGHDGVEEAELVEGAAEQGFDCRGAAGARCVLGGEADEVGLVDDDALAGYVQVDA